MKKVLYLVLVVGLLLTMTTAVWADYEVNEIYSQDFTNFEEFLQLREEIMLEQMREAEKTNRFIIRYTSVEARLNAESVIQSAFNNGVVQNAVERSELENRINRFNGSQRTELEMFAESSVSMRSELTRTPVQANFERLLVNGEPSLSVSDSNVVGRPNRRTNLTELIVLDEAVNAEDFINSVMSEMGNAIEFIQEDIRMELASDFMRFELDLELSSNLNVENNLVTNGRSRGETIVAVIDTGIDTTHLMLSGRLVDGFDFVNNTPNVFNPDLGAEQNHGTHIAGIIAQTSPNAMIMPLKVFENGVAYTSDIIVAIQFAEANGASIVNASWGATGHNPALREVIENSSMFFVAAAGNHRMDLNVTPIYPASFNLPNIISVASTNQDMGLSFFSNFGAVDIAAVGRNVESAIAGGKTGTMTGTSVAAAFVSAAAAEKQLIINNEQLIIEERILQSAQNSNLREMLMFSADKLSHLQNWVTNGNFLNIDNLVNGVVGQALTVTYEDDFDRWFERTPSESWELFNASPTVQVAAGFGHTVALKANGTVWAWGFNGFGQLGVGDWTNRSIPTQVIGLTNVRYIAVGDNHTMAITIDGQVAAWGLNSAGQLWVNIGGNRPIPTFVHSFFGRANIISAGVAHTALLSENNTVYIWGANNVGQLGDGTTINGAAFLSQFSGRMKDISAGGWHTVALMTNGDVYAWGDSQWGQLGLLDSWGIPIRTPILTPTQITSLTNVEYITVGSRHTVAIVGDGNVYVWGGNSFGELGLGGNNNSVPVPVPINFNFSNRVKAVSAGDMHTIAVTENGDVYTWGDNSQGQLGRDVNSNAPQNRPAQITNLSGVKMIASGTIHTVALMENGDIYTWGNNSQGQLGLGRGGGSYNTPQRVVGGFNVFTPDIVFRAMSGMPLSQLTNGRISANVSIGTNSDGTPISNIILIMSLHRVDGNTMVAMATQSPNVTPGQAMTLSASITVPHNYSDYYIRVMIWDSIQGMNQIQSSVILDANGIR